MLKWIRLIWGQNNISVSERIRSFVRHIEVGSPQRLDKVKFIHQHYNPPKYNHRPKYRGSTIRRSIGKSLLVIKLGRAYSGVV